MDNQQVPQSPGEFFESFFPEQFRRRRGDFPAVSQSSAVTFVVEREGAWSFYVEGGELVVKAAKHPAAKLQVVFSRPDFEAVVMRRATQEMARSGHVSQQSLAPFRVLFAMEGRNETFTRETGSILFVADDAGERRKMQVVPGAGEVPEEARTVFHLTLPDMISLLGNQITGVALFMRGRLKISGDLAYAIKANSLLM